MTRAQAATLQTAASASAQRSGGDGAAGGGRGASTPAAAWSGATTSIDVETLSDDQYAGLGCVVCGHMFSGAERPVAVGYVGSDHHYVYACPRLCARRLDKLVTDNRPKHALTAVQWPA